MKLQLTDSIFIESDGRQYILKQIRMNEDSEVYERVLGYYGTIRHLIRGLVEKEIKSSRIEDFTYYSVRKREQTTRGRVGGVKA